MMEQITVEDIIESMHDADLSHSDAVILNAACMPGIERLRELELRLRKPVLQGDQVSLWSALLRQLGTLPGSLNWGGYLRYRPVEINKKLSRRERVYLQLAEMTQQITMNRIDHFDFKEYDATGIGKCLNITMNNTCMELNSLVKDGLVVKILGRPVYFFAREELAQVTGVRLPQCIWENYAQFREALNAPEIVQREEGFQTVETDAASKAALGTSFSRFVGADQSLKKCIDQARSAILYPPNGLHTLIIGETGTGKSYFAEAMYDFAVETGMVNKNTKFVIYNCASYSENPQLLLSQLFGYKKGAFTGADRECPGIIDQADGGVLFLDEAHRLSPEGQEKMFLLIDKGIFQRLGETQNYRKAAIRIIAATTEDPQNALLSTFLRRIA